MKFIFEVRIKPGYSAEEYADKWVRASELIQEKGEFEEPEWVVLPPDNGMDPAEIY